MCSSWEVQLRPQSTVQVVREPSDACNPCHFSYLQTLSPPSWVPDLMEQRQATLIMPFLKSWATESPSRIKELLFYSTKLGVVWQHASWRVLSGKADTGRVAQLTGPTVQGLALPLGEIVGDRFIYPASFPIYQYNINSSNIPKYWLSWGPSRLTQIEYAAHCLAHEKCFYKKMLAIIIVC